jgi:hypothetical protein
MREETGVRMFDLTTMQPFTAIAGAGWRGIAARDGRIGTKSALA